MDMGWRGIRCVEEGRMEKGYTAWWACWLKHCWHYVWGSAKSREKVVHGVYTPREDRTTRQRFHLYMCCFCGKEKEETQ